MVLKAVKPILAAPLLCAAAGLSTAQPVSAQEVVQQLPDPAAAELTQALQRLSRNPTSVPALLKAGRASLQLNDIDAAEGFFDRAQNAAPNDGRVMAGMAIVALRRSDPVTALQLFADADRAGHDLAPYAGERGLALDLVGRNSDAQRLYRLALERGPSAAVTRRLALSYAISGEGEQSERVLLPLLQRGDNAAYRTRAFALAILGRSEEAVSIAETMLPARLSNRLEPYLLYMPRLTRAQQAAAANLGRFPAAAQIGRDEASIVRAARDPSGQGARLGTRLIPEGPAMGEATPAEPLALPEEAPQTQRAEQQLSLAEAFSDFSLDNGTAQTGPREGAVDITSFEPERETRPEPAPPPPPTHPSRHWVQVATGQNVSAFRFDWRRLVRQSGGALEGRDAYRASWGRTNRLVTGPFASTREAQQFVTRLSAAGISAFRWTSDTGEEVIKLQ